MAANRGGEVTPFESLEAPANWARDIATSASHGEPM